MLSAAVTDAAKPVLTPAPDGQQKPIFIDDGAVGAGRTPNDRWTSTATNGTSVGSLGDGITLTWSVVPDGTLLGSDHGEPNAGSNFQSEMSFKFGGNWLNVLQGMFDQWSAVSGVTYQYVGDDGAAFPSNPGALGARGDVRLGSHPIDGVNNVLAYNYYPNGGDMVVDSDDLFWGSTPQLQYVLAHEHGHGLGLSHVLPGDHTKLMEPVVNTNFTGPQFDDIYRAQILYGDAYEKGAGNDVQANGVQLGTNPGVNIGHLSLSGTSDQDWFKFTLNIRKRIDMVALPEGSPYMVGENGAQPTLFDPRIAADMKLDLLNSSGTIVGTSNIPGPGNMESIGMDLSAGTYYAHILPVSGDRQMYSFSVQTSESAPLATIAPVSPDPRSMPVTSMTISFDKPVNGFDLSDLSLSRDTNATSLAGATLTTSDNQNFTLGNISAPTDRVGTFTLTLNAAGSGITSQAGNVAMNANANESWQMTQLNGTSGNDNFVLVRDGAGATHTNVYLNNVFQYWFLNNASMLMSASMGNGQDTLNLDYNSGPMLPSNLLGFDGGAQLDSLQITATNADDAFSVAPTQLTFGAGSIIFSTTETVSLSMSGGNDSATILATTGTSVTVDGGSGVDSVTFNTPAQNSLMNASANGFSCNTTSVQIFGGVEQGYMQGNSNTGVSYLVTGTAAGRPLSVTGGSNNELFTVSGLANDFPAGVTINGGGGIDQLTADDSGLSGNSTYQITAGQIQKDNGFAGLAYSNINRLDVVAETGNNAVNVNDAGQLNTINIDAGAGNDTVTIAGNFGRTISPNGGAGIDSIVLSNPPPNAWMVATPSQLQCGPTFVSTTGNFESASMVAGNDPAVMFAMGTAAGIPLYLIGGAADDVFALPNTNSANFPAPVIIDGAGGNDTMLVDDSQMAGNSSYSINDVDLWKSNGFAGAHFTNVESASLYGEQGTNDFNVEMLGAGVAVSLNGGPTQDSYGIQTTGAGRPATILNSAGDDTLSLGKPNGFWYLPAQVVLGSTMTFGSISILPTSRVDVTAGSHSTITTKNLSFTAPPSWLNLNDNDFIFDYSGASQLGAVQGLINYARNGGAWNSGFGITSDAARDNPQHNTTLGAMEATDFKSVYGAGAAFNGQAIDNTAVLIKYTYYGDTDFNGKVDGADYARLDAKFNQQSTLGNIGGWLNGDCDGNGKLDGSDYALIDGAFNSQGAAL